MCLESINQLSHDKNSTPGILGYFWVLSLSETYRPIQQLPMETFSIIVIKKGHLESYRFFIFFE